VAYFLWNSQRKRGERLQAMANGFNKNGSGMTDKQRERTSRRESISRTVDDSFKNGKDVENTEEGDLLVIESRPVHCEKTNEELLYIEV